MSKTSTMTVRLSGTLADFVATNVGENGSFENVGEYIRDLIRRDKERTEKAVFDRLKIELAHAFAAPESSYKLLTAAEVIARNRN
jgi:Arc/MetJ-type ribon-helix-helix transcriptional regulator